MLPTLQIGPLALPTYPLLLILGMYMGLWVAAKVASRRGMEPDHIYNAGFYAFVAAVVAGRLGHAIRYPSAYLSDPLSILSPNIAAFQTGFAVVAAFAVLFWYRRKHQLPALSYIDGFTVGALGTLAVVALADALNGRHFGTITDAPWAMNVWEANRHPVQLYEMLGILLVLALIWRFLDRMQPGQATLAAIGGYAAVRLVVDAFRDNPAMVGDGFRLTQLLAFLVLLLVLLGLYQMLDDAPSDTDGVSFHWE